MLRTLGGLRVEGSDFGRGKPLLVLAYLTQEGPQLRSHLAELFWPRSSGARRTLTTTLGRLRQAFPGMVDADHQRAWSQMPSDAQELRRALGEGDVEYALGLYRGPFLDGAALPDWSSEVEEWLYQERESIAEALGAALLRRAKVEAARGHLELAAGWAERVYTLPGARPPEPELLLQLHELLRATDHHLVPELRAEAAGLGLELSVTAADARAGLEAMRLEGVPHNLPARGGPFIGREVELAELNRALSSSDLRLLTLVGPGGTGKTRLSLQAARECLAKGTFPDGVYFVGLEAITDLESASAAIAEVLGSESAAGAEPLDQAVRLIGTRRMLLVLDNVEQLSGSARLASNICERCDNLTLLVTSRERLELANEWVFTVSGLSFPSSPLPAGEARMFDALQLFSMRSRQVNSGFELTEADVPHVLRLCRLLNGAPLGLELAAAWTHILSPREIVDEVERTFDFLGRRSGGSNERHQNLRMAFTHSWQLLSDDERAMLRRLSVFRGGFDRSSAQLVTEGMARTLLSLVDKSLVQRTGDDRYGLHEVTRQYAGELLVDDEPEYRSSKQRHAERFLALAEEAETRLKGAEQVHWLSRLALERDNLRAALDWAESERLVELGLRMSASLQQFWWSRGPYLEGYMRIKRLLELPGAVDFPRLRGKAMHRAGTLIMEKGDFAEAGWLYREALELAEAHGDEQVAADALHSLGLLASKKGDAEQASSCYRRCISLQRSLADRWGLSVTLNNMAMNHVYVGRYHQAREFLQESLEIKEALGETQGIAYALNNLGTVCLGLGEIDAAQDYVERSLVLKREIGDLQGIATSIANQGRIAGKRGHLSDARTLLGESLRLLADLQNSWALVWVLTAVVELDSKSERTRMSLRLAGGIEAHCEELGIKLPKPSAEELNAGVARSRKALGAQEATLLLQEGRGMSLDELVAGVLEEGPGSGVGPTSVPGTHR